MNTQTAPINLYQLVLERVDRHLALQMELGVSQSRGEKETKEMSAMSSVLSYPPIAYLTKTPEYISDIEKLDQPTMNWIVNFVNYVTMDWSMMVRTMDGDVDYFDSFIGSFEKTITGIVGTNISMEGYSDRIDVQMVKDPVALTYFMLATSYRQLALNLGVANGRASAKPVS